MDKMKVSLFIGGIVFCLSSYGQIDLKSVSLNDPDMNIMYAGIENHIKVQGLELDNDTRLVSSKGEVRPNTGGGNSDFYLSYTKSKRDTLRLFQGEELLFEEPFEVRILPEPVARLGEINTNSASVSQVLDDPSINIVIEDCYWDYQFSFSTFDLKLIDESGNIILSLDDVEGTEIPEDVQKQIKELKHGDALLIKNIIAYCQGCPGQVISPISITIKD
jgi:hypothetical protein